MARLQACGDARALLAAFVAGAEPAIGLLRGENPSASASSLPDLAGPHGGDEGAGSPAWSLGARSVHGIRESLDRGGGVPPGASVADCAATLLAFFASLPHALMPGEAAQVPPQALSVQKTSREL